MTYELVSTYIKKGYTGKEFKKISFDYSTLLTKMFTEFDKTRIFWNVPLKRKELIKDFIYWNDRKLYFFILETKTLNAYVESLERDLRFS